MKLDQEIGTLAARDIALIFKREAIHIAGGCPLNFCAAKEGE
jgi:hypothetical protein